MVQVIAKPKEEIIPEEAHPTERKQATACTGVTNRETGIQGRNNEINEVGRRNEGGRTGSKQDERTSTQMTSATVTQITTAEASHTSSSKSNESKKTSEEERGKTPQQATHQQRNFVCTQRPKSDFLSKLKISQSSTRVLQSTLPLALSDCKKNVMKSFLSSDTSQWIVCSTNRVTKGMRGRLVPSLGQIEVLLPQFRPLDFSNTEPLFKSTKFHGVLLKDKGRLSIDNLEEKRACTHEVSSYAAMKPSPNCECINCLCLSKIKQIATLKEYPAFTNEKQIYQVRCFCPINKASKIPIATNSPIGPPKVKVVCTCAVCHCNTCKDPKVGQKDSKLSPKSLERNHPEDCDCIECNCPNLKAVMGKGKGDQSHDPDCDCAVCKCPGAGLLESIPEKPPAPPKIRECDCAPCRCSTCADPKKKKTAPFIAPCDCVDCKCSPCADPAKREGKGDARQVPFIVNCECSALVDPKPVETADVGVGSTENKTTHPPGCICDECLYGTEKHRKGCVCPECRCADCYYQKEDKAVHVEGCTCSHCVCTECPKKEGTKKDPNCNCADCRCEDGGGGKVAGITPCHCDRCQCADCVIQVQAEGQPTQTGEPALLDECQCPKCVCDDCLFKPARTMPGEWAPYDSKPKRGPNCNCADCTCIDCGSGMAPGSTVAAPDPICNCSDCKCTECAKKLQDGETPPFEIPLRKPCSCPNCKCPDCTIEVQVGGKVEANAAGTLSPSPPFKAPVPKPFEAPIRKLCDCPNCQCVYCSKDMQAAGGKSPPFEVSVRKPCNCPNCQCSDCTKEMKVGDKGEVNAAATQSPSPPLKEPVPKPFEVPVRILCDCPNCQCVYCSKDMQAAGGESPPNHLAKDSQAGGESPTFEVPVRKPCDCRNCQCPVECKKGMAGAPGSTPICRCDKCLCDPCTAKPGQKVKRHCECPTCTCVEDYLAKIGDNNKGTQPGKCNDTNKSSNLYDDECHCPDSCMCPDDMKFPDVSKLGDDELKRKIQTRKYEKGICREQIKEIREALDHLERKWEAVAAVAASSQSRPFVKRASKFGATISGLKVALSNLVTKCKAKDRMILIMTDELKCRTSSNTFNNLLNKKGIDEPLDYDKATVDVKSPPCSVEKVTKLSKTCPYKCPDDDKSKKSKKTSAKICRCSRTHRSKDSKNSKDIIKVNKKIDLDGFEVIDIGRITDDSLIIKWKRPPNDSITGYDIFVNDMIKSKVMCGDRTSAMIHSLNLSSSLNISIYALTRQGQCQPPATARYEVKSIK